MVENSINVQVHNDFNQILKSSIIIVNGFQKLLMTNPCV